MVNWTILNHPQRKDKRNVAVASAFYANVHEDWIRFWDAKMPEDFESPEAMREYAGSVFEEFYNPHIPYEESAADVAHILNVCRYLDFKAKEEGDTLDMFVSDDVYARRFGTQIAGEHFFCWVTKTHLSTVCQNRGFENFNFVVFPKTYLEFSTLSRTGYCFYHDEIPVLDADALLISRHGAKMLLCKLLSRVRNFGIDYLGLDEVIYEVIRDSERRNEDKFDYLSKEKRFRFFVFAEDNSAPGVFVCDTPLFKKYPPDFFRYAGEFDRLFKEGVLC